MISGHVRQVLSQLPAWNPTGDIVAQRRAWEELATVYNRDLPAIGGLEQNVELRSGLRADVAVPKGAGRHPVVIYLHGGGWAFGSPASFRKLGMQFACNVDLTRIRKSPRCTAIIFDRMNRIGRNRITGFF